MLEFLNFFAVAAPVTFPNSLFTQHPLVLFAVRPPRTYRGKECATRLVHTSVRIPVGNNQGRESIRKPVSQTQARGWRHQGCEGLVFAFQPNKTLRCCSQTNRHHVPILFNYELRPPCWRNAFLRYVRDMALL